MLLQIFYILFVQISGRAKSKHGESHERDPQVSCNSQNHNTIYAKNWKNTASAELKLAVFATAPAVRSPIHNLISEIIATMVLVLALLFIGANRFADGLNPLIVGLLIISIGLSLGGTTGFAINPARDLGPRIAHAILPIHGKGSSDWGYAWVPVVGPLIGSGLGVLIYHGLFV